MMHNNATTKTHAERKGKDYTVGEIFVGLCWLQWGSWMGKN